MHVRLNDTHDRFGSRGPPGQQGWSNRSIGVLESWGVSTSRAHPVKNHGHDVQTPVLVDQHALMGDGSMGRGPSDYEDIRHDTGQDNVVYRFMPRRRLRRISLHFGGNTAQG